MSDTWLKNAKNRAEFEASFALEEWERTAMKEGNHENGKRKYSSVFEG